MRDLRNQYPFRGDEELDISEAMRLMDHMQSLDELERQLERTQYGGDIDDIDEEKLREAPGRGGARDACSQLRSSWRCWRRRATSGARAATGS